MATVQQSQPAEQVADKGLKSGALGLISSTVIATASVAPAYSIAATLVFVVLAVGLPPPPVARFPFLPSLLPSIRYSQPNNTPPPRRPPFPLSPTAFPP